VAAALRADRPTLALNLVELSDSRFTLHFLSLYITFFISKAVPVPTEGLGIHSLGTSKDNVNQLLYCEEL
jgi:hypothetical protein